MAKDLTPKEFKCTNSFACPGVFELEDGRLLIVGRIAKPVYLAVAGAKVGAGEAAIVIERGLLAETGTGSAPSAFQSGDSGEAVLDAEIVRVHSILLERLKLKYAGDCKCGNCYLVPGDVIMNAANLISYSLPRSNDEGIKPDERTAAGGAEAECLRRNFANYLLPAYSRDPTSTAVICDELIDSTGRLLGYVRDLKRQTEEPQRGDTATAANESVSLTPNSTPQEAPAGPGEGLSGIIEPQDV